MKQKIFYFLTSLLLLANLQRVTAQQSSFCTDFNNGSFAGWKSQNIDMSIEANGPNGNSDKFLKGKDDFGTSFAYNDIDFKGDWTKHLGKCLCWNVKAIITGSGATEITPSFSIYVGIPTDPANASLRAAFYANFKINDATGWKRLCAPIALLDANGNLPKNSYGEWKMIKGTNADWNTLLSKVQVMSYGFDYGPSNDETYGVDNICLKDCEVIGGGSYCGCPNTTNLITNGDFENGATGFTSKFNQMANSFVPGTYTVVDGDGARALCDNWLNASACGRQGKVISKFLAVNGKTGQQGILTAWGQAISVETGKEYKLCFNLGNLRQCCFNVDPKVTILYNDGVQQKTIGPITVSTNNTPCNWLNYSTVIVIPSGPTPTINLPINIALDQSGLGDGNDLAIDDISLIKLNPLPTSVTDFGENISSVDANGKYTITATASALPVGAGFYWEIQDITDPANPKILTNPSQWWSNPLSTNFNGYDNGIINNASIPGIFVANRTYRIVRGTWGDCNSWGAVSHIYRKEINGNRIIAQRDNSYVAPNKSFSNKAN